MAEPDTVELSVPAEPTRARVRVWRGLTGALVAGWGAVVVVLVVAQVVAWSGGGEGPGAFELVGHAVGLVFAGGAQFVAERSDGVRAGAAGAAIALLTLVMLWVFWWS
ncbi:hypothetical protein ACWGRK_21180 [Saccharomonospora azurea]|uniref:Uncharacterized protein n=1 Tax=Saccharomonospora azurea NA-128 TaxID=882081 RepID=H8G7J6_9PSEU|nr:hypothetical protein [Saccharomonospora azurea]EHK83387.1 hypothetical protein SZMC14600_19454 [Saccharomonospora azurea SZMC 14600]EHY90359.1 hypothetical protein SacazDRAFT_03486 [Saccharomonospora azurea NA-128]